MGDSESESVGSVQNVDVVLPVVGEDGKVKVYFRRHLVLLAFAFSSFSWNFSAGRQISIAPTYARYHDTTNEVSGPESNLGIDTWTVVDSGVLLVSYFFGAYAIDRWGLKMMSVGSFALALSSWFWYFSGTSNRLVILSRAFGSLFGPLVNAALLAISNRWYPASERGIATGIASLISIVGSGFALIVSPMFATEDDEIVDLDLRSCEGLAEDLVELVEQAAENETAFFCTGEILESARESFCCYLPVDVESLNLVMAIVPTLAFIFTAIVVRDLPPTPPSFAGEQKDFVGPVKGLKMLFSLENFSKLALSDFIISGPPLVLVTTLSRSFPPRAAEYSFYASAGGLALAIPVAVIVGHYLDKTQAFYTFTMAGYSSGTIFWIISTICFASGTLAGEFAFVAIAALAIAAYVAWQVSVYETKLEYAFTPKFNLEGWIVGADRIVINLSSLIFVTAIPPENVGGALNTSIIGAVIMFIGCLPTALITNKYRYKRKAFDDEGAQTAQVAQSTPPSKKVDSSDSTEST